MAKYETNVQSSATSLYEVDGQTGKNVVAGVAFEGNPPHLPKMLEQMHNSLGVKLFRAYNYGRDTYTYGLPNGYTEIIGDAALEDIEDAVEESVGYPVDIENIYVGEPDPLYFAEYYGWLNWGWKYDGQYFTNPPVLADPYERVTLHSASINDDASLTVVFDTGSLQEPVTVRDCVPTPDQTQLYYHIRFVPKGSNNPNHGYWIYKIGTGDFDPLDYITSTDRNSPYMPIIPIRQDNKNMGPSVDENGDFIVDEQGDVIEPDTELYRTSKKLCDLLDTDFMELCKQVDSNPDVSGIDHAYIIMGIDIRSTHKTGKEYLYQFFQDLAIRNPGLTRLRIEDAYYKILITFDSITYNTYNGSLSQRTEMQYSGQTLTIKHDNRDGTYGQVVITNLLHTNYVYENHAVQTSLSDSADPDNYNFVIPLNYELVNTSRSLYDRYGLIQESFKIIFNSYERRKLKWYETGIFKAIMIVVAIVAIVYTAGTFIAGIQAAYAAGGISAAITYTVTSIAYATAINFGFRALARALPPEFAIAVAVMMTVLTISGAVGSTDLWDAEQLLEYSSAVFEGTQQGIQDDLTDLQKEIDEYTDYTKELEDELASLEEELYDMSWFELMNFNGTEDPLLYESPTDFFTRTIHAGNIGVATLSAAENYVDSALTLPNPHQI